MTKYKKFNFNKFLGLGGSSLVIFLILINFQNCAPRSLQNTAPNEDQDLRIVDDWQQNKLLFVQPYMIVDSDESEVNLYGICDRKSNDSYLWIITNESNNETQASGTSFCEGGGFKLVVDNLDQLACNQNFNVNIIAKDGSEDIMTLSKECLE